jgi:coenzyme F420-reducing hydrogenase beta subunit
VQGVSVIEQVVDREWCIGCGMCAAVCPGKRLEMRFNGRGEYNPEEVDGCTECGQGCSLCYQLCPSHGNTKSETDIGFERYGNIEGIRHTDETGYYLSSYVGYSDANGHRENGASGGFATWTLETLLDSGAVDAVVAVGRTEDPDKLFEFKICRTTAEVRACSRSAYYPVELSQVLEHVLNHEGRYAIIGLPCVCKAIRLAQEKRPKLRERLKYVMGLTCGHTCSRFYAEYICALGGGNPHALSEFAFRTKDPQQPSVNIGFSFRCADDRNQYPTQVFWRDGIDFITKNGFFQLPGCFHCDDVFAECADAVFMDAWLPEFSSQPEGHSIVLIRSPELSAMFGDASKAGKPFSRLGIDSVKKSQINVIRAKREKLIDHGDNLCRRELQRPSYLIDRLIYRKIALASEQSGAYWVSSGKDIREFSINMGGTARSLVILYGIREAMFYLPRLSLSMLHKLRSLRNDNRIKD